MPEKVSKKNKMIELVLWHQCNTNCVFCCAGGSTGNVFSLREAIATLDKYAADGATGLILGGGEPTIFPNMTGLAKAAKKIGFSTVEVKTNGIRFCYPEYVEKCMVAGLDKVSVSLWGHDPGVHDYLAGIQGAFEKTEMGLKHLIHFGMDVKIDFLVSSMTLGSIGDAVEKFSSTGVRKFDMWAFSAFGAGGARKDLTPGFKEAGNEIVKVADLYKDDLEWIRTSHIPPCCMDGRGDLYFRVSDMNLWIVSSGGRAFKAEESPFEKGKQIDECKKCKLKNDCSGPRQEYLNLFGSEEFIAVI